MTAPEHDTCDGCGRRGREMRGVDLLDGGDTFQCCQPCQDDAVEVCGQVRLFTLEEAS